MKSLPFSLGYAAECNRCTKIIKKFIKPGRTNNTNKLNPDRYIPEKIFLGAKGFAIFTIAKAGFLWAGCLGTGLVVAKLPDGSWSAPSAIALGGASFGAQIGGEIISLVIVLNTVEALRAFSLGGNFTLGGQLSVTAGPFGRTGEIKGTARNLAAVYSYSKSKGLFAGISIEGACIMERTNTNQNFFKRQITAKEILSGFVSVPDQAVPLTDALSSFSSPSSTSLPRSLLPPPPPPPLPSTSTYPTPLSGQPSDSSTPSLPPFTARANFDFRGEREGDLTFQKGDLIQVLEYPASMVSMVTSSSQVVVVKEEEEGVHQHTWWVGECHGRRGMFPANYCTVVSPSS